MTEPTYTYIKGQGWIPFASHNGRVILQTFQKERAGKQYRVLVIQPEEGDIVKRAEYLPNHRKTLEEHEIGWWEDWEGIPAGFGGGVNMAYYSYNNRMVEIITVPLD